MDTNKNKPSTLYKIRKMIFRPFWQLRDLIYPQKYRPEKYWKARHKQHGFACRGVGDVTQSEQENIREYALEKTVFLEFCKKHNIDFAKVSMLDVGCGTGVFAEVFRDNGGTDYVGIDITDELFPGLLQKFGGFKFKKMDVGRKELPGQFDLIIMISVAQHIVDEKCFSFAMQNIRKHLSESGTFIVTIWKTDVYVHPQPHVVGRPASFFQREFPGYWFSEPESFGSKNLYAIKKHCSGV